MAILAAAAAASVLLAWRGLRREPDPRRRRLLTLLRAASALLAVALLVEPAVLRLELARVRHRLAILVDGSRSMRFPVAAGGPSRAEAVAGLVAAHRRDLAGLAERYDVDWYAFGGDARPTDAAAVAGGAVAPRSPRTDLLAALRAAAAGSGAGARRLAGVLLLSDGADNAGLAAGLDPAARAELRALGVPVNTVAAGREPPRDVAIEKVAVDPFAFVRSRVTVGATLRASGFGGEPVTVALERGGSVVATAEVRLPEGGGAVEVPLTFSPDTTGTAVYTVSVPLLPGEAVAENNRRSFVLRVIRDRIRVLLVAGRPSWDERFLRGLLRRDPNVDLVSFFILRTAASTPGPQEQLSLIPFPVQEIFGAQIHTFDAVVLLDFGYAPYRSLEIERFLPDLRDYVRGGGALAMVGGEQSFGEGGYGATPLAEVLPVEPLDGAGMVAEPFRPRLTAEGRRHPITALGAGEAASAALWDSLPPLETLDRTRPLPPGSGATVLLEAPGILVDGRPAPVVAARQVGAGRTLAIATDGSWRWGFVAAERGGGDAAYRRFWGAALRWLVRDPEMAPLSIEPDAPEVEPGERIGVTVKVRGADFEPAPGAAIAVELIGADGHPVARRELRSGPDGTARVEFPALPPGAYRIAVRGAVPAGGTGAAGEEATTAIAVRGAGAEDVATAPRPDLLAAISSLTGGDASALPGGDLPEFRRIDPEEVEVGQRRDLPVWNRWWALALLASSLALEWVLRRRWGLE